jgi:hypothetical protein
MASSLTKYYDRAKSSLGNISEKDIEKAAINLGVAAGAGVGVGALTSILGTDKSVGGIKIPIDAAAAVGLAVAHAATGMRELEIASFAAAGIAAERLSSGIVKSALGKAGTHAHGDMDEGTYQLGFGYGADTDNDQLIEDARSL